METVEEGETNFENEKPIENIESTTIQNDILQTTEQPLQVEDNKEIEEQKPQTDEVKTEKILQDDYFLSPPSLSQPIIQINSEEESLPKEKNSIYNEVENNPSDTNVPVSNPSNSVTQETTVKKCSSILDSNKHVVLYL